MSVRTATRVGAREGSAPLAEPHASTELAGEPIQTRLTAAPGGGAPFGGIKITAASGWFAARPSGTEAIYKIYAESFRSAGHLGEIQEDARAIVGSVLGAVEERV